MVHGRSITVELRSVNNRYLDCTIKLPRIYVFAEDAIKSKVQAHISRGKVDVFVTIGPSENGDVSISVNKPVADGYYAALCALRDSYGLKDDISVSLLGVIGGALAIIGVVVCRFPRATPPSAARG